MEQELPAEAQAEPEWQSGQLAELDLQLDEIRWDQPLTSEPTGQTSVQAQQKCTDSQWLRWIGEQIAGVFGYIEAEERAQTERLLVTTDELETARSRIRCLEQDLDRVTTNMAKVALTTTQIQAPVTLVNVQNNEMTKPVHTNKTLAMDTVPKKDVAQAQELAELRDELAVNDGNRPGNGNRPGERCGARSITEP